MDADLFADDLTRKPESLRHLSGLLERADPWSGLPHLHRPHIVFVGMGSSHYASSVVAARLRAAGVHAVAELASSDLLPRLGPSSVVVAVSASGGSKETLDALDRLRGDAFVVSVTNRASSALASSSDLVVDVAAGDERGGVACRSFVHTLAVLLVLEARLVGTGGDVPRLLRTVATATDHLLARRDEWLPTVTRLVAGRDGTYVVAPVRRFSSAQQSALMLREGPRRPAVGCETGDWSHVDVYLTKTQDYRLLLLAGSRWEPELLRWTAERGATVVAVGGEVEGAACTVRYPGDEVDDVRLLTETLVAELVAADLWRAGSVTR